MRVSPEFLDDGVDVVSDRLVARDQFRIQIRKNCTFWREREEHRAAAKKRFEVPPAEVLGRNLSRHGREPLLSASPFQERTCVDRGEVKRFSSNTVLAAGEFVLDDAAAKPKKFN